MNTCSDSLEGSLTTRLTKSENLEILKTENGFLDSWETKNTSYLVKRSLDIFLDPVWRHKSISNRTFIQRRFHQSLRKVETVDLVFSPKVSKKFINYNPLPWRDMSCCLQVNMRLAGTALPDKEYIIPVHYLHTEVIEDKKRGTILRVHIGQMIRNENYFPLKKDAEHLYFFNRPAVSSHGSIYLKEMILSASDHNNDFFGTLPLERIDFLGFKASGSPTDTPFIKPEETGLINIGRDFLIRRIINPLMSFFNLMAGAKPSWKPSWESPEKHMEFFNEIAPRIDNFYYLDEPSKIILFASPSAYYGALKYSLQNIPQFYFPDKYQLFLYLSQQTQAMPVGKNSEVTGIPSIGPGYPSIDVVFHSRNLFYKSLYISERTGQDFSDAGVRLDQILENPNGKKILNILGVDFLVFRKNYLKSLPPSSPYFPNPKMRTPSEKMKGLLDMGLIPFDFPKSYKIFPRFPDRYGTHVLKNPESYGKAFIAKWVKTIKPDDNHFNKSIFELGMTWPKSRELLEHFNQHLLEIPDNQGATLIESMNAEDFQINPREYQSNSSVDIVKIIGSKAVFDVDCKEGHCWLVYNTAALNGWKAFSGSERLQIHKANLGFIGIKLDRGQHFVWMEYQPWLPTIGLFIVLLGWIFTFAQIITRQLILTDQYIASSC